MSKNDNFINDAKIIVNSLSEIDNLNVASTALLKQAKIFIEENE